MEGRTVVEPGGTVYPDSRRHRETGPQRVRRPDRDREGRRGSDEGPCFHTRPVIHQQSGRDRQGEGHLRRDLPGMTYDLFLAGDFNRAALAAALAALAGVAADAVDIADRDAEDR